MKIKIKKETAEFILELVGEIESQDNRGTQRPNLFTVVDKEEIVMTECDVYENEIYLDGGYGDRYDWVDDECSKSDDEERSYDDPASRLEMISEYRLEYNPVNSFGKKMSGDEILKEMGIRAYELKLIDKPEGAFLTQKAAQAWKRANLHNLHEEAHTWCSTLNHNPEMMRVISALKEIAEQVKGEQNEKG